MEVTPKENILIGAEHMSDKGYQEGTTDDLHFLNVQEMWRKYMEEARINSALRSLSLLKLKGLNDE